ncbi:hypothetical protein [Mucilaginibacter sp. UR6-11]|uniref:hypothetical protein n=1 Tax=Mucilaginibacter sp. UR6-11 TaxID=1435644 RepID=UPI001E4A803A|nr:hypothetical protein [Mucilaginibacter sp. UR6-11]MCC8425109.1 hypothetical protein [Mucilaginibacter sp. UR6-11]
MKKFVFALFFISFFISCAKTDSLKVCGCSVMTPGLYDISYSYADEKSWQDNKTTATVTNDTLTLQSFKSDRELILKFPFHADSTVVNLPMKNIVAGYIRHNTNLKPPQFFNLDSTANNTLSYSANAGGVGGHFSLTFKLSNPAGNIAIDTIRAYFPNGVFRVGIKK